MSEYISYHPREALTGKEELKRLSEDVFMNLPPDVAEIFNGTVLRRMTEPLRVPYRRNLNKF